MTAEDLSDNQDHAYEYHNFITHLPNAAAEEHDRESSLNDSLTAIVYF